MFDFDRYMSMVIAFFTGNVIIAAGTVALLCFFLFKKPGETVKFLGFVALLVGVLYIMSLLTESSTTGVFHKEDVTTKSERELAE